MMLEIGMIILIWGLLQRSNPASWNPDLNDSARWIGAHQVSDNNTMALFEARSANALKEVKGQVTLIFAAIEQM